MNRATFEANWFSRCVDESREQGAAERTLIRHDGGIVDSPGMYLMGMPFLRRRKSVFFAAADARDLSEHLAATLADETAPLPLSARG